MGNYTIQYNFNASITVEVEANDEGEALEKGRNIAEEADIKQFTICGEREAQIVERDKKTIFLFYFHISLRVEFVEKRV